MRATLLFFFLIFNSCGIVDNNNIEYPNLLEEAYAFKSTRILDQFIIQWKSEYPAIKNSEITNDTIRLVYSLFQMIFDPEDNSQADSATRNLFLIMDSQFNGLITDSLISGRAIMYDSIKEKYITSRDIDEIYKTSDLNLNNFSPILNSGDRALFLRDKYINILDDFFPKYDYNKWDEETKKLRNEDQLKRKFLRQRINISGYGKLSYPIVHSIRIKSDFSEAYMKYHFPLAGYEVHFNNVNGNWQINEINMTWIV